MGRRIENALEGITLQIEKKAESAGPLNTYIYLIMEGQLNIQNGAFVSAINWENADNERASFCTVCSSNRSRKNTFSLGFTREGVLQSFRFHCNYLPHPMIQLYIQESKVV